MKKKIFAVVVVSMLFSGVVAAVGLHGAFEGNPIVKVTSNGNELIVSDVPAINYNGRTMIPIYMLKQLGANVEWNQKKQSVNITMSGTIAVDKKTVTKNLSLVANSYEGYYFSYIYDEYGAYISLSYNSIPNNPDKNFNNLVSLASLVAFQEADELRINFYIDGSKNSQILIKRSDAEDYIYKNITASEFYSKWDFTFDSSSLNTQPITSTSNIIKSKIIDEFEGFDYGNIYELDNGQIWKQIDYTYKYTYKYRPSVTIYKDGSVYFMIVEDVDKEVQVQLLN